MRSTTPRTFATALMLAGILAMPALAETSEPVAWRVDPNHSQVGFTVNHFFTPVSGTFDELEADLQYDPQNPEASRVTVKIPVASVDTRNDRRDNHLRSPDFFEAETYPYITFESEGVKANGDERLAVTGTLTIKGEPRRVTLPVEVLGIKEFSAEMAERMGATQVASFRAELAIDRTDYGVGVGNWASDAVVGKPVTIEILIEAKR